MLFFKNFDLLIYKIILYCDIMLIYPLIKLLHENITMLQVKHLS